ncbi:unnamed protein product [Vitrella brassicaformis CCMP3155]|uniref:GAF domain-containing protein n=2 Tax=Vitrella brassicaformis TaxID=1169539 RepID=A0A0G4FY56_VITBC|nr:unnamed protein product [Vitrella brassicaformis CCMP3155]|eukprot:CEM20090.1 unnamed protein product [Vitrella brassicaformis CCMP3155]
MSLRKKTSRNFSLVGKELVFGGPLDHARSRTPSPEAPSSARRGVPKPLPTLRQISPQAYEQPQKTPHSKEDGVLFKDQAGMPLVEKSPKRDSPPRSARAAKRETPRSDNLAEVVRVTTLRKSDAKGAEGGESKQRSQATVQAEGPEEGAIEPPLEPVTEEEGLVQELMQIIKAQHERIEKLTRRSPVSRKRSRPRRKVPSQHRRLKDWEAKLQLQQDTETEREEEQKGDALPSSSLMEDIDERIKASDVGEMRQAVRELTKKLQLLSGQVRKHKVESAALKGIIKRAKLDDPEELQRVFDAIKRHSRHVAQLLPVDAPASVPSKAPNPPGDIPLSSSLPWLSLELPKREEPSLHVKFSAPDIFPISGDLKEQEAEDASPGSATNLTTVRSATSQRLSPPPSPTGGRTMSEDESPSSPTPEKLSLTISRSEPQLRHQSTIAFRRQGSVLRRQESGGQTERGGTGGALSEMILQRTTQFGQALNRSQSFKDAFQTILESVGSIMGRSSVEGTLYLIHDKLRCAVEPHRTAGHDVVYYMDGQDGKLPLQVYRIVSDLDKEREKQSAVLGHSVIEPRFSDLSASLPYVRGNVMAIPLVVRHMKGDHPSGKGKQELRLKLTGKKRKKGLLNVGAPPPAKGLLAVLQVIATPSSPLPWKSLNRMMTMGPGGGGGGVDKDSSPMKGQLSRQSSSRFSASSPTGHQAPFSRSDLGVLEMQGTLMSNCLSRLVQKTVLEQSRKRLAECLELAALLEASTTLADLEETIKRTFVTFFRVKRVRVLFWYDRENCLLLSPAQHYSALLPSAVNKQRLSFFDIDPMLDASTNLPARRRPPRLAADRGLIGQAVKRREIILSSDLTLDPYLDPTVDGVARRGKSSRHRDGNMLLGPMLFEDMRSHAQQQRQQHNGRKDAGDDKSGREGDKGKDKGDKSAETGQPRYMLISQGKIQRTRLVGVIQLIDKTQSSYPTARSPPSSLSLDADRIPNVPFIEEDIECLAYLLPICAAVAWRIFEIEKVSGKLRSDQEVTLDQLLAGCQSLTEGSTEKKRRISISISSADSSPR